MSTDERQDGASFSNLEFIGHGRYTDLALTLDRLALILIRSRSRGESHCHKTECQDSGEKVARKYRRARGRRSVG